MYVFSTSDAVVGLSTYHEIIRSEQKFDIVWTLAVRYLLHAMSSWTTSFSLNVCWNSVGIHGIIWIYPDQSHLWWRSWIDQSLCQILGVWKEKYERRGICFQQGPGFVSSEITQPDMGSRTEVSWRNATITVQTSFIISAKPSARDSDVLIWVVRKTRGNNIWVHQTDNKSEM